MNDLSPNAKALLAAYASEHVAPADLGLKPWTPDRVRGPLQLTWRRRLAATSISLAVAAAALLIVWSLASSTQLSADAGHRPAEQAPYHGEPPSPTGQSRAGQPSVVAPQAAPAAGDRSPSPAGVIEASPAGVIEASPSDRRSRPRRVAPSRPADDRDPSPVDRPSATLAQEIAIIDAAGSAIQRGDSAAAIRALDRHLRHFPEGELAHERGQLRRSIDDAITSPGTP